MCLGRGGDQAAVKTENGFRFFGGVAKGVEKKSRAKSRIISNAIQEVINSSDDVYIMGHRFADMTLSAREQVLPELYGKSV